MWVYISVEPGRGTKRKEEEIQGKEGNNSKRKQKTIQPPCRGEDVGGEKRHIAGENHVPKTQLVKSVENTGGGTNVEKKRQMQSLRKFKYACQKKLLWTGVGGGEGGGKG